MKERESSEKKIADLPKILLYIGEGIALLLVLSFIYFSSQGNKDYTGVYSEHSQKQIVEALVTFLKLYNVHEIPYFGITPKIQIYIKENTLFVNAYYLEIIKGQVIIKDGGTADKDIIIRTTEAEVSKIVNDSSYIQESFSTGRTTVEKAASNFVLFTKGYPDIFLK